MADTFTTVTHESLGSRLGKSLRNFVIGLVLFILAFPVLCWNEYRAINRTKALNTAQSECTTVDYKTFDNANEGKMVHISGPLSTLDFLSDDTFGISVSNDLRLTRRVAMYQWEETSHSETVKKTGGSTETKTTYTYKKVWSEKPLDSSSFAQPEGHENPTEWPVTGNTWQAESVFLGAFVLSEEQISSAGSSRVLNPRAANDDPLPEELDSHYERISGGFYRHVNGEDRGTGTPKLGDLKITFEEVPVCNESFAGRQTSNSITSYQTKYGAVLLQYDGLLGLEEIFAHGHRDNTIMTWLLRLVGFLMFFFGLLMLIGPLQVLSDILPFIGNIFGAMTTAVAFLIALALSCLTIGLAWIAVRPLLGIFVIAIAVAAFWFAYKKRKALPPPKAEPEKA